MAISHVAVQGQRQNIIVSTSSRPSSIGSTPPADLTMCGSIKQNMVKTIIKQPSPVPSLRRLEWLSGRCFGSGCPVLVVVDNQIVPE